MNFKWHLQRQYTQQIVELSNHFQAHIQSTIT